MREWKEYPARRLHPGGRSVVPPGNEVPGDQGEGLRGALGTGVGCRRDLSEGAFVAVAPRSPMSPSKKSAGLLLFRETSGSPEVLLVHPGGPFWSKKDDGAWSIPKGEFAEGE